MLTYKQRSEGVRVELCRQILRQRIEEAFEDVPYPGDAHIVPHPDLDLEEKDILETLRGKHWKDLTEEDFRAIRYTSPLISLTREARHFYLPAFLLDWLTPTQISGDYILDLLAPTRFYGEDASSFDRRVGRLRDMQQIMTAFQRRVVREFFEYLIESGILAQEDPEMDAGLHYWTEPDPEA